MNLRNTILLTSFVLSSILFSCSKSDKHTGYVDPNEALLESLNTCNGREHTYNRYTNILQEREQVRYFAPESIEKGLQCIPEQMRKKIHTISKAELPFTVGVARSNIVTSWNANNRLVFQIQFSYFKNTDSYNSNFKEFFTISATQYPKNPFLNETVRKTYETDFLKGNYEILTLVGELPLYRVEKPNDWTRMFDFYIYNEKEKKIDKKTTGACEYYTWYNGVIFRIGFKMNMSSKDAEALVREIILKTKA
jgi:hypothetical protein